MVEFWLKYCDKNSSCKDIILISVFGISGVLEMNSSVKEL